MIKWRPEGWEKLSAEGEAGADAMLEVLKKNFVEWTFNPPTEIFISGKPTGAKTGWLVFIPDEE